MNYFYIPTTTLNFNNILSTGSISPAYFYKIRKFGSRHFENVAPNPFDNILILYDLYPIFNINDTSRDNYPMVLRIHRDILPNSFKKQDSASNINIYSCEQTIYFDSTSVSYIFPSQEILNTTIAKSEPSLNTKLIEVYKNNIKIINFSDYSFFEWNTKFLENIAEIKHTLTPTSFCNDDDRINRIKGFACGYILGSYKSIEPNKARALSYLRFQRNEAAAILNDTAKTFPESIRDDVNIAFLTLELIFTHVDVRLQKFDPQQGDFITIINGMISEINDHQNRDTTSTLLIKFVNDFCLDSNFYGDLTDATIIEGAKSIRGLIGDNWEGSEHQKYINELINIKSGSTFDFDSSNNSLIQSFAAFVLKGDDLQKLEDFLISHGIGNFRIAFALWGAMHGFSKIPKNYYNLPFQHNDNTYGVMIHQYTHSIVHNIPFNKLIQKYNDIPNTDNNSAYTTKITPTIDENLLFDLKNEFPGIEKWLPKLNQILNDCKKFGAEFIKMLKNTNIDDLGGRLKNVKKADVILFFENKIKKQRLQKIPIDLQVPCYTKYFWDDAQVWDELLNEVPVKDRKKIKADLRWLNEEWKNPNSDWYGWNNPQAKCKKAYQKMPLHQRTNKDWIDALCSAIKTNIFKQSYYPSLHINDLNKIRSFLDNKDRRKH